VEGFEEVRDAHVRPDMTVRELLETYRGIHGFMAGHLAEAVEVLREGLSVSRLRVLSFTANLVATGLRGVIRDLIDSGLFNVVITTAGALDHDIARSMGGRYLRGYFEADDAELHERGYHRLGNVFIPVTDYGPPVERFVRDLVAEALRRGGGKWPIHKLVDLAGEMLEKRGATDSILAAAHRRGVRVFVPGWPDGAFGTALFMEAQRGNRVEVDYYADMAELADLFFPREGKAAALIVGGGISKHHTIWWSQFRDGLDYVVYVTTAVEYDGSLSGAHPREAISWGKVKPRARRVVVYGDATILLPLIAASLLGG
jgi:deoxyhypusine synthase